MIHLYGLIGYPLSHSFSKNYFTQKFQREGISDCLYELFPLERIEMFPELIASHPNLEGLNVTIPYKEKVLPYVTEMSDAVKDIGACNCIQVKNGKLTAFNTDVVGFEHSLKPLLKAYHTQALVLGTGGAAKAVVWVLQQMGITYQCVSRSGGEGRLRYDELTKDIIKAYPLIINTTPLGMQPNVKSKPSLPYEALDKQHLCFDLVYNPSKTVFLQEAERRGAVIKNGLEMLELQAEAAWNLWNR
ncbi:MAG TPA: shikimate dehydrogenase [Lacibacter sp.]|nr:shikimate dehydrogenase [Lacibacter sp.]